MLLGKEEREALRLAFGSGRGAIVRSLHAALDDIDELRELLKRVMAGKECNFTRTIGLDGDIRKVLDD